MPAWNVVVKKALIIGIPSASIYAYFRKNRVHAENFSPNEELYSSIRKNLDESKIRKSSVEKSMTLEQAQRKSRALAQQTLIINGYPGVVFGVSHKGKPIWIHGFGYANVETNSRCNKDTVMRIASINKPITMLAVAKLVEEGKLDLDKNINEYLGEKFPIKKYGNKTVSITLRQLASHFGGIRHYDTRERDSLKSHFENSIEALKIFKDDNLVCEPGTKFNYSTFSYTVISAVIESVLPDGEKFGDYLIRMCQNDLGMNSTYLDKHSDIILNRASHYERIEGNLVHTPYVDASYKYGGGGILSSIPDLLTFGNIMLYSYKNDDETPGYLTKTTVDMLWSPIEELKFSGLIKKYNNWTSYGLGWGIIENAQPKYQHTNCPPFRNAYFHTGATNGATSLLLILPDQELVIALFSNLEGAKNLMSLGVSIAKIFIDYVSGLDNSGQDVPQVLARVKEEDKKEKL